MKKLLVVESPTKARTIGKYLGNEFEVIATVGHLRDLPKGKMGVNLTSFEVDYQIAKDKKEVVSRLKKAAKEAEQIILATDPDREGEAISWHVNWILSNPESPKSKKQETNKMNIVRATFHEITKNAVLEALGNAREIDMDLVDAQQGRRVLDRVVGYSLSPVLWKKVRRGLSAGRVQSVAVRLIAEREKEINAFKKENFFKVNSSLKAGEKFLAELTKVDGKNIFKKEVIKLFDGDYTYSRSIFANKQEVEKFVAGLEAEFTVEKIESKETRRTPLPPFTTSKLQQAASRKFGWSGKQTMSLAQRLYEQGLITYHRTDSVNLSEKAIADFREFIEKQYGANYLSPKIRTFKNTSKNAQEAHEAIRPTEASKMEPTNIDSKELKLYQLIWKRAVATQGAAMVAENNNVYFTSGNGLFKSSGIKILFDGFLKITGEKTEDQYLPAMTEGQKIKCLKTEIIESETTPPPRYSEASLVASLEKQGIGRPSTYAPIISTIQLRQYVEKEEGRFRPTVLGSATNEFLVKNFEDILSLPFTAKMEEGLDKVAMGKANWKEMMKDFWKKFEPEIKNVEENGERVKVEVEKLGKKCPECKKGELVIRVGKYGKFVSCDNFPECKYTAQYHEMAGFKCPECGAEGVVRKTKTGRKFFGCSKYPKCKWAGWKKP
ncbi:MAG TPA: type I DNA topoisomerase [Candidatus Woesebacteria bacterium]|nr:type I DNA topoisomerase [Candidatus Woesebacteria bacterium]